MNEEVDVVERHPLRFLIKLTLIAGLVYLAVRVIADKKDEYIGLTETEAREKLIEKVGPRLGEDTASEIADQVIPKLKDKGLIKADETTPEATD